MTQRYDSVGLIQIDDSTLLRALVGDKAAEMVELARDCATIGAPFPGFSVVGVGALDRVLAEHGVRSVPDDLPELPAATDFPLIAASVEQVFVSTLREALADREGVPAVLRSSLLWPPIQGHRLPGVDNTLFLASAALPPQPNIIAQLYRAYTTLCLSLRGLPTEQLRRAGVIVMRLVPQVRWQGTAYLFEGHTSVEISANGDGSRYTFASMGALRGDHILAPAVSHRLEGLCADLAAMLTPARDECIELEFLINMDDDVYVLQRRRLPAGAGVFHTPGQYCGPLTDLRELRRADVSAVDAALDVAAGQACILASLNDTQLDSFSLAWRLRSTGQPAPAALVLLTGSRSRSGLPMHVPWMLREALPDTLLICPADGGRSIPERPSACRLESDGVAAALSWT